jgi:hypothetical protein
MHPWLLLVLMTSGNISRKPLPLLLLRLWLAACDA